MSWLCQIMLIGIRLSHESSLPSHAGHKTNAIGTTSCEPVKPRAELRETDRDVTVLLQHYQHYQWPALESVSSRSFPELVLFSIASCIFLASSILKVSTIVGFSQPFCSPSSMNRLPSRHNSVKPITCPRWNRVKVCDRARHRCLMLSLIHI